MNKSFLFPTLLLVCASCTNSNKNNKLSAQKKEPVQTVKEVQLKEIKEVNYDSETNVELNLIKCENEKFTIQVDQLDNDKLRYLSWNKPKNKTLTPDLVLSNGSIEKQGTMGGYTYTFENADWTYIIEDVLMGESEESTGIFLKLQNKGKEISRTKMKDLKN